MYISNKSNHGHLNATLRTSRFTNHGPLPAKTHYNIALPAEATCSGISFTSFAAIWRLKSFVFRKTKNLSSKFICTVPDYPNVCVSIPWNSVPDNADFSLTLKVPKISVYFKQVKPWPLKRNSENIKVYQSRSITCQNTL